MPIDALLVLARLRRARRIDVVEVAAEIQKDGATARGVLERLVEAGLVKAHGVKKGRTYTLSPAVYRRLGQSEDYVRQAGFDRLQQEEMVKRYVQDHAQIRRRDVVSLCGLSPQQATRLLKDLCDRGLLEASGRGKGTRYARRPNI